MLLTSNFSKNVKDGIVLADRVFTDDRLKKIIINKFGMDNLSDVLSRLTVAFEKIAVRPIEKEKK